MRGNFGAFHAPTMPAYRPGYTAPQTRRQQEWLLSDAARANDLENLFWYLVVKPPGEQARAHGWKQAVVALPTGPDIEVQRALAEIMCAAMATTLPGCEVRLEILGRDLVVKTNLSLLDYGDLDVICPRCAGVVQPDEIAGCIADRRSRRSVICFYDRPCPVQRGSP